MSGMSVVGLVSLKGLKYACWTGLPTLIKKSSGQKNL